MSKIAILLDGNNIFHSFKTYGDKSIDYKKLVEKVNGGRSTEPTVYFYTLVKENAERQPKFISWMKFNGFKVISKLFKENRNNVITPEMSADLIDLSYSNYDTIIVVSGNTDLTYAIDNARKRCSVEVVADKNTTSVKLRESANHFLDLAEFQSEVTL